ncbi:MAG: hypothetical protein U1D06_04675 [Paracoccaceae bacterium]|nr:hypothetical protein [Paracoccaceae bacterium]
MDRRRFLWSAAATGGVLLFGVGPALAKTSSDQVVSALKRRGYSGIEVSRTWLGRTRIVGKRGKKTREVILNRSSGEVLRDIIYEGNGVAAAQFGNDRATATRSDKQGSGGNADGSSDDDSHDDDSHDDDSSDDDSHDDDSHDDDE